MISTRFDCLYGTGAATATPFLAKNWTNSNSPRIYSIYRRILWVIFRTKFPDWTKKLSKPPSGSRVILSNPCQSAAVHSKLSWWISHNAGISLFSFALKFLIFRSYIIRGCSSGSTAWVLIYFLLDLICKYDFTNQRSFPDYPSCSGLSHRFQPCPKSSNTKTNPVWQNQRE